MKQPDFEGFARAIMEPWEFGDTIVSTDDLEENAKYFGLVRKEPYDPAKHGTLGRAEYDVKPGDDWYVLNYPEEREKGVW